MKNFYLKLLVVLVSEIIPLRGFKERSYNSIRDISYFKKFVNIFFSIRRIKKFSGKIKGFQMAYDLLEESYSKNILIRLIVAHIYGFHILQVSPRVNTLWKKRNELISKIESEELYPDKDYNYRLLNLKKIGIPVILFDNVKGIHNTFLFEQYRYNQNDIIIEASKGDIIFDAGGGLGNSALYFSTKIKNSGRIYTFEFINSNIEILRKNLSLNPNLEENIELVKTPLWSKSDQELFILEDGASSMITLHSLNESSKSIKTISIDDFVKRNKISKVDFIKMDIEGAELHALMGAQETLVKFKPKLAISVYHDLKHYYKIPQYINSLNLNYKMYLDHFSVRWSESVLFAKVDKE